MQKWLSNSWAWSSQQCSRLKFCLCHAGDTPTTNRIYFNVGFQCVPVLLSDDVYPHLGFARFLNWTAFSVMESADVFLKYASPHARIASSSQPAGHGATVSRAAPAFN